jgi:hypothetical protein
MSGQELRRDKSGQRLLLWPWLLPPASLLSSGRFHVGRRCMEGSVPKLWWRDGPIEHVDLFGPRRYSVRDDALTP